MLELDTRELDGQALADAIEARRPPRVAGLLCEFPVEQSTAPKDRRWLRDRFERSLSIADLDDAELIIGELVANAVAVSSVCHPITMSVRQLIGGLLIEVQDDCEHPPRRRTPTSWEEEGRGLLLVARLCGDNWGWQPLDRGKVVWALYRMSNSTNEVPTPA